MTEDQEAFYESTITVKLKDADQLHAAALELAQRRGWTEIECKWLRDESEQVNVPSCLMLFIDPIGAVPGVEIFDTGCSRIAVEGGKKLGPTPAVTQEVAVPDAFDHWLPLPSEDATKIGARVQIVCRAYADSEHDDCPVLAVYTVDETWLRRLLRLALLCRANGLTEVRVHDAPEIWGSSEYEDEQRLQCGELVVTREGGFWFTDHGKYAMADINTSWASVTELFKAITERKPGTAATLTREEDVMDLYERCPLRFDVDGARVVHSISQGGFWSNQNGWGELEGATVYGSFESSSLPKNASSDAVWMDIATARVIDEQSVASAASPA